MSAGDYSVCPKLMETLKGKRRNAMEIIEPNATQQLVAVPGTE
jgi:hypothetical protein